PKGKDKGTPAATKGDGPSGGPGPEGGYPRRGGADPFGGEREGDRAVGRCFRDTGQADKTKLQGIGPQIRQGDESHCGGRRPIGPRGHPKNGTGRGINAPIGK